MLVQSERLELVTYDEFGNEIGRSKIPPFKEYFLEHNQALADAAKVPVGPNQKVEIVKFLNNSHYHAKGNKRLIF